MTIWTEVLKNKVKLSKNLLIYLQKVFEAYGCEADIKTNYNNWQLLKNMS